MRTAARAKVSALDAALTANAHNKTLYEEKLSWWDKMHLEGYIVPFRGERNSSLYVHYVAEKLAEIKNVNAKMHYS